MEKKEESKDINENEEFSEEELLKAEEFKEKGNKFF
jgi:hypothetical protein